MGYRPPGVPFGIGVNDVVPPGMMPPGYGGGPALPGKCGACCKPCRPPMHAVLTRWLAGAVSATHKRRAGLCPVCCAPR